MKALFDTNNLIDYLNGVEAIEVRRLHRMRLPDAIVLASARAESALLVTRNTKDFPGSLPGVRVPY